MCNQQSLRSACEYAQSDQRLCWSLDCSMSFKLLAEHHLELLSLKGGWTCSSESTLVKIPHCWKSSATAHYSNYIKVKTRAKIRTQFNQAPHLTQDTNGKVTSSQLVITNESQEVSPFPAGDHKASINRRARKYNKTRQNNINYPQKKHRLGTVSKNILLEGLNRFNGAPTSPVVQMWIKTHRCLVCMKDP